MIYEIRYKARCKDCKYQSTTLNPKTKRVQACCTYHECFITKKDLACKDFELCLQKIK